MSGPEQHDNAGQLLVEIIRSCRDSQLTTPPAEKFSNPLLATAESAAPAAALTRGRLAYSASPEKKMVKLAPLKMAASHSFERFMAVP